MMHGEVCGDGGVAVDGKGLRSAALNCLTVYRPAAEVIAAVCGRGEVTSVPAATTLLSGR